MKRKCKICKQPAITTTAANQGFCGGPDCGIGLYKLASEKLRKAQDKKERKELKARKDKLNDTIPVWTKKVQGKFNAYIRERDAGKACISCGKTRNGKAVFRASAFDAGHYRSVGSCPELRFEPLNCHRQCVKCNRDLSGNAVEYRINLVKRIGTKKVEWLEGPHEPKRYRVPDLKELYEYWSNKLKEEKAKNEAENGL